MTVPVQQTLISYTANGTTTNYTFPFRIELAADLQVLLAGVPADVSGFTVAGIGSDEGSVTFNTAPATGVEVLLYREVALERDTDYQDNGDLRAPTLNADFDRIWMALQDISGRAQRAIQYPIDEINVDGTLPAASSRASTVLGFDALGNQTLYPIPSSIGAGDRIWAPYVAGTDFTAGTTTALILPRTPGAPGNLQVFFDGTNQTPDQWSVSGTTLTFTSPIPLGITKVYALIGTTLSINVPPDGSVGTATIADHSVTASKIAAGTGGFYTDVGTPPQVWKFADRVRIGNQQAMDADLIWDASPVFTTPFGWQERDSALFVGSNGRLAISAISQTSKNVGPFPGPGFNPTAIAINGLTFNDDTTHSSLAWAGYFEAYRIQNAGAIYGMEIDVGDGNLGGTVNDPYTIGGSAAVGILLNSGGSTGMGYQQPSSAALIIGNNGSTFRRGIVINHDSLTAFPGQDAAAISMGVGHAVQWFNATGNAAATIRSDVSAAGGNKHMTFTDTTIYMGNNGLNEAFVFSLPVTAANGFQFSATAPGNGKVAMSAQGPDANLDFEIDPKGGGVLSYGNFNGGAPSATGYIFFKTAGDGVLRKLLVG